MRAARSLRKPAGPSRSSKGRGGDSVVPPALALAALSGAAALCHELLWTRRLIDLLGAGGETTARVFGCFFLGLALGSAWAGRLGRRVANPWKAAAMAEAAVAVLTLPVLFLPEWTAWLWPALGPRGLSGPAGGLAKLFVSALVLLPPTIAMGAVLPLLADAILIGPRRLGRDGIRLYAANTLGGVAGVGVTVLLALQALGTTGAMVLALGLNLVVACGLAWLGRMEASPPAGPPPRVMVEAPERPGRRLDEALPGLVAFASGAGILAAEVLSLELVMLVAPLSFYAPAAILAAVVLTLGLAALLAPAILRRAGGARALLPTLLSATAVAMTLAPLVFMSLAMATGDIARGATLPGFLAGLVALVLASVGLAALPAGLVFPASLAWADRGPGRGARKLGRMLALNGLGGLVGSEAAYRFLLPNFGIHGGLAVVGLFYGVVALAVAEGLRPDADPISRKALARPLAAILVALALGLGWIRHLPSINPHLDAEILDQRFGREGAVAVVEGPALGRAIIVSNQYILGSTAGRWDQERQAHLPLLLHPHPREVGFIGLATGMTPGAALDHRAVESVTAVELSPLVVRAADRFFPEFNHRVTRDPRARVVVEDGRTYLAASAGRFDVVIGDLFLPWAPGEGRLFSVEHFRDVRRSLRPGGVFCQWLPMYQLTPGQFELIAETFRAAFPRVHLIRNGFDVRRPMVGLVGFRDGDLDWTTVSRRCGEARDGGRVLDPVARHPEAVGMLYVGRWDPRRPPGPVNTLGNMSLELDAGRERITGNPGRKYVHGARWLDWLHDRLGSPGGLAASSGGPPGGPPLAELMQVGFRLSAREADRLKRPMGERLPRVNSSESPDLRLPSALLADRDADWARWPGMPLPLSSVPSGPPVSSSSPSWSYGLGQIAGHGPFNGQPRAYLLPPSPSRRAS